MPIKPDAAGTVIGTFEHSWGSDQCLIYALGVGAGTDELEFTTENTAGVTQAALPTMAVVLGMRFTGLESVVGSFDWTALVHAEQAVVLNGTIPVDGAIRTEARVGNIYDKGKAAVVEIICDSVDAASGEPAFTTRGAMFIRGEGGWGGDRGPSGARNAPPERPADKTVTYTTSPDQALLYRLSGDRNPLHSDPSFAQRGGFDRPILHGLCTYGFTGRALLHTLCGGDPARFRAMEGRFTSPVFPGDELTVSIWAEGTVGGPGDHSEAVFQTTRPGGTAVLDGRCRFDD